MTSAPAIGFEYRPSRQLAWLQRGVVLLAMVAVLLSGLTAWLTFPLLVLVVTVPWLRGRGRGREGTPVAAGWSAAAGWTLRMSDGRDEPATLSGSRVLGGCVLLQLACARRRHTIWLFPDNSDADIRRRLRMRLAAMTVERPEDAA